MASGITNKGKYRLLEMAMRDTYAPTGSSNDLYVALVTIATTPDADTNTLSQLTEIAAGNGYTSGGFKVDRNSTDWDVLTEDDSNDYSFTQIKDVAWTASGGGVPSSGAGARWAVLTDDHSTVGSREVYVWWDLSSARSVNDGATLTLQDLEARLT